MVDIARLKALLCSMNAKNLDAWDCKLDRFVISAEINCTDIDYIDSRI